MYFNYLSICFADPYDNALCFMNVEKAVADIQQNWTEFGLTQTQMRFLEQTWSEVAKVHRVIPSIKKRKTVDAQNQKADITPLHEHEVQSDDAGDGTDSFGTPAARRRPKKRAKVTSLTGHDILTMAINIPIQNSSIKVQTQRPSTEHRYPKSTSLQPTNVKSPVEISEKVSVLLPSGSKVKSHNLQLTPIATGGLETFHSRSPPNIYGSTPISSGPSPSYYSPSPEAVLHLEQYVAQGSSSNAHRYNSKVGHNHPAYPSFPHLYPNPFGSAGYGSYQPYFNPAAFHFPQQFQMTNPRPMPHQDLDSSVGEREEADDFEDDSDVHDQLQHHISSSAPVSSRSSNVAAAGELGAKPTPQRTPITTLNQLQPKSNAPAAAPAAKSNAPAAAPAAKSNAPAAASAAKHKGSTSSTVKRPAVAIARAIATIASVNVSAKVQNTKTARAPTGTTNKTQKTAQRKTARRVVPIPFSAHDNITESDYEDAYENEPNDPQQVQYFGSQDLADSASEGSNQVEQLQDDQDPDSGDEAWTPYSTKQSSSKKKRKNRR
jgi:hypothetical protein